MDKQPWEIYQAIYLHIPFCKQKCLYCDFSSYANCLEKEKTQYLEALCKEIAAGVDLPVAADATIYFGGGTPSLLSIEQITTLVQALKKQGLWQQPKEATIEVNPGTVDFPKLQALKELGFTRVSMGVQSLNAQELKTIGRIHTVEQALEALNWAQQAGFTHLNADVIYGLPGQTLASLQATLTTLCSTPIDHLSVYGLIVEENTPLERLLEQGKLTLPEEDLTADMYDWIQAFLQEQGFTRYEISNYYRTTGNGYSRHNDVYWRYQPYAAFGASAASFNGHTRTTRPLTIPDYLAYINQGEQSLALQEQLSSQELLSEFMMMGLRRRQGVDLKEAYQRYGANILEQYAQELEPFIAQKLVKIEADHLALTEAGMAVGNQIFALFV